MRNATTKAQAPGYANAPTARRLAAERLASRMADSGTLLAQFGLPVLQ